MFAELYLTDTTNTFILDLLSCNRGGWGFGLDRYTPGRMNLKGGGMWQDSPIASGRRLVGGVRGNVNDVVELKIVYKSHNEVIQAQQTLDSIIEMVDDYWMTNELAGPVYLVARAPGESRRRYAIVYDLATDEYPDPYHEPFAGNGPAYSAEGMRLGIERSAWLDTIPQTGTAVDITPPDIADAETHPAVASVPIANRWSNNIGNISRYNGSSFASNPLENPFSSTYTIFHTTPAAGHITYFGGGQPFGTLVFDIGTAMAATSWTIIWEYYNGSTWATLTVDDNTNKFQNTGVRLVTFKQPYNWATVAVNSATLYWVRARISALTGTPTNPTQQNRHVYANIRPYVEIDSDEVSGDLDALAKISLAFTASALTDMRCNQIYAGLRKTSRGANFQAYLNVKTADNPSGVTVTLTADTSIHASVPVYVSDPRASTGFLISSTMATTEEIGEIFRVTLGTSIANEFRGHFRLLARVTRSATSDVTQLRYVVASDTAFGSFEASRIVGEKRTLQEIGYAATGDLRFEVADLGQIRLPLSDMLRNDEDSDAVHIIVEGVAGGLASTTLYVNDLILLPIDEWGIEAAANSIVSGGVARTVEIDSIGHPKHNIRTVQRDSSDRIVVSYRTVANQEAILHANADQRMWVVLSENFFGLPLSHVELPATVSAQAQQRYFHLRAD